MIAATELRIVNSFATISRSLDIMERQLGADHPDIATRLNNLVMLYNSQRLHSEAEAFYERSLSIFEKAYPPIIHIWRSCRRTWKGCDRSWSQVHELTAQLDKVGTGLAYLLVRKTSTSSSPLFEGRLGDKGGSEMCKTGTLGQKV
ncbi:MAG: tetratricopeptide repeat protein [Timaviella obliquedivisa GSE-PSE-MK23-08B]|jgi:hypothetical protein|nr:tetratricopeptide repeat protein [Timaviella obliquedivisa GSE-PSE-MK23-08B]